MRHYSIVLATIQTRMHSSSAGHTAEFCSSADGHTAWSCSGVLLYSPGDLAAECHSKSWRYRSKLCAQLGVLRVPVRCGFGCVLPARWPWRCVGLNGGRCPCLSGGRSARDITALSVTTKVSLRVNYSFIYPLNYSYVPRPIFPNLL